MILLSVLTWQTTKQQNNKTTKLFLFIDILFVTIRNPCQSDKSVFEKKLSGETNTDYKDITDFISHIAKRNTMGFHET